ncbi:uncharacterized protein [Haliotis asinina]|uniref:uncharacterized protein n=1 Tax=Haliotis asinina TaxID=109174 RepID=UPI003531AD13
MYLVVEFSSTGDIGLIPESWLASNGKQCYWPTTKNINMLNRAVKTCQQPNEESWELYDIRILYKNASYDKARKKLPLAEETSDLYTDVDDGIDGIRKKRPNRRYLSTSSEDEEERDPPAKCKRTGSLSVGNSTPIRSPTPPPLPHLFSNRQPASPAAGESLQSSPLTPLTTQTEAVRRSPRRLYSATGIRHQPDFRPPSPLQLPHRASTHGASTAEVLQLIRAVEENTATTKTNNQLLHQLLRVVTAQSTQPSAEQRKLDLPLKSLKELHDANTALDDAIAFRSVVMQLGVIGGSCLKHTVYNILEAAFTTPLARSVNWIGSGTKAAFKGMKMKDAIVEATRKSPVTQKASNIEIESFIKLWFRNAADRDGGRKEREKKKTAASTVTAPNDDTLSC